MLIDLDHHGGGILIEGTKAELRELARGLAAAAEDGESERALITDTSVDTVAIRCTDG